MNKQQFLEAHEIILALQSEFKEAGMSMSVFLHQVPGKFAPTQYHILKKENAVGEAYYMQEPNRDYVIFLKTPVNGGKVLRPLEEILPDLTF